MHDMLRDQRKIEGERNRKKIHAEAWDIHAIYTVTVRMRVCGDEKVSWNEPQKQKRGED